MKIRSELPEDFPKYCMFGVVLLLEDPVKFDKEGWVEYINKLRSSFTGWTSEDIRNDPIFRAYRDFYWHYVKVDPTKIRPSSEALLRRLLKKKTLPSIHPIVDSFNAASVETKITVCAYDIKKIHGDLVVRLSNENETFFGIGMKKPVVLKSGLVVIDDSGYSSENSIVSMYPYRDADRTKLTDKTVTALITVDGVPTIPEAYLHRSLNRTMEIINKFCQVKIQSNLEFDSKRID